MCTSSSAISREIACREFGGREGRGGVNENRQSSETMDWRTEMHWESNFVDSNLEVDKRLVSMLALRLRRRKGEDGSVISDSSPPLKSESDVLQGCKY
jgi:hypothetical protein